MRKFIYLLLLLPVYANAQPPGYYSSALGLNGQPLREALYNIIKISNQLTYTPDLWNAYYTTDVKPGTNKVWDIYSDVPGGTPAYEYTLGSNQCGNGANHENTCYNREHIWPQSKFNSLYPMYSDLWIAYPTDYYVNNQRADYPYGIVGTATKTFTNGTKIGNNIYSGAPTTTCFEPIDSFKGDIARSYFYIVTRFLADSNSFTNWEMADKITLKPWAIQMLLDWHHNDPVSQKEIDRNNATYALQNNRNPYIDYPQFADCIWGNGDCTSLTIASFALNKNVKVFPNPATNNIHIDWKQLAPDETISMDIINLQGQIIWHKTSSNQHQEAISVSDWARGVYLLKIKSAKTLEMQKIVIE